MTPLKLPCRGTVKIWHGHHYHLTKCVIHKIGDYTSIVSIDGVNRRVPTSDVEIDIGETYNGVKR